MVLTKIELIFDKSVLSINERNHNMSVPVRVKVTLFVADLDSISETSLDYKARVAMVQLIGKVKPVFDFKCYFCLKIKLNLFNF